jgi:hypothetical protein
MVVGIAGNMFRIMTIWGSSLSISWVMQSSVNTCNTYDVLAFAWNVVCSHSSFLLLSWVRVEFFV